MKSNRVKTGGAVGMRDRIIEAAGACVDQFGLGGTTVLKVAEKVGVSRQTVHAYFPNRDQLIGAVIFGYMMDSINRTLAKLDYSKPSETVLEEAMVHMFKAIRRPRGVRLLDPRFREVALRAAMTKDIAGANVSALWLPILTRFQSQGQLRDGVSLLEIGKWLYLIHFSLLQHEWLTRADVLRFVQAFVVPSVLKDHVSGVVGKAPRHARTTTV